MRSLSIGRRGGGASRQPLTQPPPHTHTHTIPHNLRTFGSTNTAISLSTKEAAGWEERGGRKGLADKEVDWKSHGKSLDSLRKLIEVRNRHDVGSS